MYQFKVEGMSCNHCIQTVTKAVQAVDAGAKVVVDLKTQTVQVESQKDPKILAHEIEEAGYPCKQV